MTKIQNSSKQFQNDLITQHNKNVMKIEMNLYLARQTRMLHRVQRYFNSTPLRNAFARWMAYAFFDNKFYTISQLAEEMHTNRQSISRLVNECESENYIIVKRQGKTVECRASSLLMEKVYDYCNWRQKLTKEIIGKSYYDLVKYESMISKNRNT